MVQDGPDGIRVGIVAVGSQLRIPAETGSIRVEAETLETRSASSGRTSRDDPARTVRRRRTFARPRALPGASHRCGGRRVPPPAIGAAKSRARSPPFRETRDRRALGERTTAASRTPICDRCMDVWLCVRILSRSASIRRAESGRPRRVRIRRRERAFSCARSYETSPSERRGRQKNADRRPRLRRSRQPRVRAGRSLRPVPRRSRQARARRACRRSR